MVVWHAFIDETQRSRAAEMAGEAGLQAEEVTTGDGRPVGLFLTPEHLAVMTFDSLPPTGRTEWYSQLRGRHAVLLILDPIGRGKARARIHVVGWRRWIVALIPGSIVAYGFIHSIVHPAPGPIRWGAWAFAVLVVLGLFALPALLATIWWAGCIRAVLALRRFMTRVASRA